MIYEFHGNNDKSMGRVVFCCHQKIQQKRHFTRSSISYAENNLRYDRDSDFVISQNNVPSTHPSDELQKQSSYRFDFSRGGVSATINHYLYYRRLRHQLFVQFWCWRLQNPDWVSSCSTDGKDKIRVNGHIRNSFQSCDIFSSFSPSHASELSPEPASADDGSFIRTAGCFVRTAICFALVSTPKN